MKILGLSNEFLEDVRSNIRFASREKFKEINQKYSNFCDIYNGYISSSSFKRLLLSIKKKYDDIYQKLFLRHAFNFLNIYLRESDSPELTTKRLLKFNSS